MARKAKPTILKLINGNPGQRPLNRHEPQPGAIRQIPKLVRDRKLALKKWHELVSPDCWGMVITRADMDALEAYCLLYDRMAEAEAEIGRSGAVVASSTGFERPSAWIKIADACRQTMHKIQSEFGGLPAARARLSIKPSSDENEPNNYIV